MTRPPLEVADLIRAAGTAFIERNRQWRRWTQIRISRKFGAERSPNVGNCHCNVAGRHGSFHSAVPVIGCVFS